MNEPLGVECWSVDYHVMSLKYGNNEKKFFTWVLEVIINKDC